MWVWVFVYLCTPILVRPSHRWEDEQRVMQKLDVCVSFGPKIPKIPIVVPGRVLVREGEAYLIENKGKTKVFLLSYCHTHIPILPYTRTAICPY